ncbi:MAG: MoaD/ThiS family protein [Desulfobacteraceae bacterium]|jgi:sulfur carrier protein ThiS
MKIELRLFASLAAFMPEKKAGKPLAMEVSDGTTIRDLLQQLKVPRKDIKVIFLNGVHASDEDVLKEGDRVGVFPAVGGG